MTILLAHQESYLKEFTAVVTAVNQHEKAISLDQTAFYPSGGGQPCDYGTLYFGSETTPVQVRKVKRSGEQIWHWLGEISGPLPDEGVTVKGGLDWTRRYQLMRTHTAMHILCGVIWRDYEASVTGGNMEPLKGRMDFEFASMKKELVSEIEEKINLEVAAAREVAVKVLPREEAFQIPDLIRTKINLLPESISEVRTVEIIGLDLQADGGTHVANTREVGEMRIVGYKSKGKINKRLQIELVD